MEHHDDQCMCACHGGTISLSDAIPNISFEVFQNNDDRTVSLADFKDSWLILFFYPGDFTFVCPTELQDMAEHYVKFKEGGAEIISVSTDSVHVHKAWHDTSEAIKNITFPMGSDTSHELSRAFGVLRDSGRSDRGTFIIDPSGKVQVLEITAEGIGRSAAELLRKFQAAKFVHEHGDKVCPANWKPGGDTLEPGMDLVGKI